jgi:hypothetical protein
MTPFAAGAPAITTEEVSELLATEVPSQNGSGSEEAPYGYKGDGTPRKRPAPAWVNDPAKLAAAAAKRSGPRKPKATAKPALDGHEASSLLDRSKQEIRDEEQRLARVVGELRAQHEQAQAELDSLTAALQAAEQEHARVAQAAQVLLEV